MIGDDGRMTTFALVHGAWHGAWCWESVVTPLRDLGHDAVAVDLPADDPTATFDTYADVVCAALDAAFEGAGGDRSDVVVVGHSLAGNTIPLVAARRPVRHLVYLCALLPDVGRSMLDQIRADADMLNPDIDSGLSAPDAQRRRAWTDLGLARALFFADCDEPTALAALQRLRPQATYPYIQPFSLAAFPPVPATYVVCTDDRMVGPGWSRRVAPARLCADIVELPGGHSPFLSRPHELADVLHRVGSA